MSAYSNPRDIAPPYRYPLSSRIMGIKVGPSWTRIRPLKQSWTSRQ